jgi:hypothetical protein
LTGLVLSRSAGLLLLQGAVGEFSTNLLGSCTDRGAKCYTGKGSHLRVILRGNPFEGLPCRQRRTGSRGIE